MTAPVRIDLAYGLMGLPLAFVALPLYVHLPPHMATQWGWSLTFTGAVLLGARVFDALIDPALGRWSDRLCQRSPRRLLAVAALASVVLAAGLWGLFGGSAPTDTAAGWAVALPVLALVLATTANSLLSIAHQAWGAALHSTDQGRSRAFAWREGSGLLGVLVASSLPLLGGWNWTVAVLAVALAVGWLAWARLPVPPALNADAAASPDGTAHRPWHHPPFRRLMAVFVLNGIAGAIPATLVILFMTDRLGASSAWQAGLLTLYFAAGALGMPVWLWLLRRWGLAPAWGAGMVGAALAFSAAALLDSGDVLGFAAVCAASGLMLGADLALPAALLAQVLDRHPPAQPHRGLYFGWWALATKLNLALAAGLALPLLSLWGYEPGTRDETGLQALGLAYSGWPVVLKLAAAVLLYRFFIRQPFGLDPHHAPAPHPR